MIIAQRASGSRQLARPPGHSLPPFSSGPCLLGRSGGAGGPLRAAAAPSVHSRSSVPSPQSARRITGLRDARRSHPCARGGCGCMEVAAPPERAAFVSETLPLTAIVHQILIALQSEESTVAGGWRTTPFGCRRTENISPRTGYNRSTNMPPAKLTQDIILAAIDGFESQKSRIDAQIAELRQMLIGGGEATETPVAKRGRRKLNAGARARIAEAQRKRWAAQRQVQRAETNSAPEVQAATTQPKRKLSAAGRKAIIEATEKRWARVRAEAAKSAASSIGNRKAASKKGPAPKARPKQSTKPRKKASAKRPAETAAPVSATSGTQAAE
jgi:hypothetical protein